jgi:hypothetical protein
MVILSRPMYQQRMLTVLPNPEVFDIVCSLFAIPVKNNSYFLSVLATQIFLMPALIIMSIAATRMHRSLVDFCSADVYAILLYFVSALS